MQIYLWPVFGAALLAAPFLDPRFFPTAWVAFLPLLCSVQRAKTQRQALVCGWLMGIAAHLFGFYWLVYTISVFGGFPYPASVAIFILYAMLQGIQLAIFAALVRRTGLGPLAIFPALLWVPMEFLFPLLFPWYAANSQVNFVSLIQNADIVGPYGTSFLLVWLSATLCRVFFIGQRRGIAAFVPLVALVLSVVAALVYGKLRLAAVGADMASAPKLAVAGVQGNIDIDLKWNPERTRSNLEQHRRLTRDIPPVDLVVWPESAVEDWIPENIDQIPSAVMPALKNAESFFIFGAKSFNGKPGTRDMKAFNTAFFTSADGRVLNRYHKQKLLAFGEYLPFAGVLRYLPALPFADGFTPGQGPVAFQLSRTLRAGPLICYEDLMPEVTRRFVSEAKANLLLTITNDAWYGRSVGPWEHLRLSQWRAIETRRNLLRITNTGVTSLVNAKGELVKTLPMFVPTVMRVDVAILTGETLYVRYGDWFAWLCTVITIALVLLGRRDKLA